MIRALVIPIAAGVMLLACKHSEKLEILASGHTEATRLETSQSDSVTTVSQGPERTTTTIEEFSAPVTPPQKEERPGDVPNEHANYEAHSQHPTLLKRTVVVTERGPVLTESHVAAKDAITATVATSSVSKAVHEEKSAPATGCLLGGSLLAWAVPLVLAVLAWKFRKVWWP